MVSGKLGDDVRPGTWRAILVTGQSLDELTARAREAIRLHWESVRTDLSSTSMVREIEVELPA